MLKLGIEILVLTLLFCLEGLFPLFAGRKDRFRHALPNLAMGILNGFVASLLFSSAVLGVIRWAEINHFGILRWCDLPPFAAAVSGFVLFDFWMYGWHRMNHGIPFLWRFHRMHHSDLAMDATTALRFHTGEIILSSLIRLAVIPLLGLSFVQLLIYEICLQPVILFHHSNVALPEQYDRVLRSVLVTPNMHRIHHSRVQAETDSNYSSIFSFWDRWVRTFRMREDTRTIEYGLGSSLQT